MFSRIGLVLLVILFASFACRKNTEALPEGALNKERLLQLVNTARAKGCNCGSQYFGPAPALAWNSKLEQAALAHTKDMQRKGFFSHTGSDGRGVPQRVERSGYQWMSFGENIGQGYETEAEAVQAWLKSPGHCKNIMNPKFKEIGAAKVADYWTQVFGSTK